MSNLTTFYTSSFAQISRVIDSCPALQEQYDVCFTLYSVYQKELDTVIKPTTDQNERLMVMLNRSVSALEILEQLSRKCKVPRVLKDIIVKFYRNESTRQYILNKFNKEVADTIGLHGLGHAAAIGKYIAPYVNTFNYMVMSRESVADDSSFADLTMFYKKLMDDIKLRLQPLSNYKNRYDPSKADFNKILQQYRKESSNSSIFANNIDPLMYLRKGGMQHLHRNTPHGRAMDPRALERAIELMTLGHDPDRAVNSVTPQIFDLMTVSKYQPQKGKMSNAEAVQMLKNEPLIHTNLMKALVQKNLTRIPRLQSVPLVAHRTDYDYVKSIVGNEHNYGNRKYQEGLSEMMTGIVKGKNGEPNKVSNFSRHIKVVPKKDRLQLAALRKQYSLEDKFTSSGRLLHSTSKQIPSKKQSWLPWK